MIPFSLFAPEPSELDGLSVALVVLAVGFVVFVMQGRRRKPAVQLQLSPTDRPPEPAPFDLDSLTWPCRICGDQRPDRFIGVAKHNLQAALGLEAPATLNVTFCNDREICAALAERRDYVLEHVLPLEVEGGNFHAGA